MRKFGEGDVLPGLLGLDSARGFPVPGAPTHGAGLAEAHQGHGAQGATHCARDRSRIGSARHAADGP